MHPTPEAVSLATIIALELIFSLPVEQSVIITTVLTKAVANTCRHCIRLSGSLS